MNNLKKLTLMLALTGALVGGTAMTAHAAEDGSGLPNQTQTEGTDAGAGGGDGGSGYGGGDIGAGTGGGGGSTGSGSTEGNDGEGSWWGQGDTSGGGWGNSTATGAVPAELAATYMANGFYDGAYVYSPTTGGLEPTQGDLDAFNAAKGGTCSIGSYGLVINCTN